MYAYYDCDPLVTGRINTPDQVNMLPFVAAINELLRNVNITSQNIIFNCLLIHYIDIVEYSDLSYHYACNNIYLGEFCIEEFTISRNILMRYNALFI